MKIIDKQYTDILDEFFTDSSDLVNKSYYTESENYVYCICFRKKFIGYNTFIVIPGSTIVTLKKGDEFINVEDFENMKKILHPTGTGLWSKNTKDREEMYNHITNNTAFIASMIL